MTRPVGTSATAPGSIVMSILAAKSNPAAPAVSYQEIDDNDDTLVEVQLAVVVIVFGMVFVVGSLLYLLRRRLGLVAPPPDQAAIEDHH